MGGSASKPKPAASEETPGPTAAEMEAMQKRFEEEMNRQLQAAFDDGVGTGRRAAMDDAETQRMMDLSLTAAAAVVLICVNMYSNRQREARHAEELEAAKAAAAREQTALHEASTKEVALNRQRVDELTLQLDTQRGVIEAQQREFRLAEERRLEERQRRVRAFAALSKQRRATASMQKRLAEMAQQAQQARHVARMSSGVVVFSATALVSMAVFRRVARSVFDAPPSPAAVVSPAAALPPRPAAAAVAVPPPAPIVETAGDDKALRLPPAVAAPTPKTAPVAVTVAPAASVALVEAKKVAPPAPVEAVAKPAPVQPAGAPKVAAAPPPPPPVEAVHERRVTVLPVAAVTASMFPRPQPPPPPPPVAVAAVPAPPMVTPSGVDVGPAALKAAVAFGAVPVLSPPMTTPLGTDVSPAAFAKALAAADVKAD